MAPNDQKKDKEEVVRFLNIQVPMERVSCALEFLKGHTRVSQFQDALQLVEIRKLDLEDIERVSLLKQVWRAWKDGEMKPPIDIEVLYAQCVPSTLPVKGGESNV